MAGLYTPDQAEQTVRDELYNVSADTLTATHPVYNAFVERWLEYLDLYEGENLERYVFRHIRESQESHQARIKRVSYRNFCAPVVDLYIHYLFSKPINRSPGQPRPAPPASDPEEPPVAPARKKKHLSLVQGKKPGGVAGSSRQQEWESWLKDVDRRGTTMDRFMADSGRFALIFGHIFIATDMPRISEQPRTEAERRAQSLRPYLVPYFPTEVPNWQLDDDGSLVWIRFREMAQGQSDPFASTNRWQQKVQQNVQMFADYRLIKEGQQGLSMNPVKSARYRTWTRYGWFLHEIKGRKVELIDQGEHGLGVVPVEPLYNRRYSRYPFVGQSLLTDIGRLNVEILNMDSLITESVYQNVINILVMRRQPTDQSEIVIGANNVLEYSGDVPPFFLTPSAAPLQFMEGRVQTLREEIYRLAKLGGGLGLEPRAMSSGLEAAFEFNETNRMLADRADESENTETKVHRHWYRWMGGEFTGTVDYSDDFSVQSFQEELQLVTTVKQALRSPTARREMEKRAAKHVLHNLDDDVMEQIRRETDFIPESVESFSGPVWYDPVQQQVKQPGTDTPPVGTLGDIYQQEQATQAEGEAHDGAPGTESPPTETQGEGTDSQQQAS